MISSWADASIIEAMLNIPIPTRGHVVAFPLGPLHQGWQPGSARLLAAPGNPRASFTLLEPLLQFGGAGASGGELGRSVPVLLFRCLPAWFPLVPQVGPGGPPGAFSVASGGV